MIFRSLGKVSSVSRLQDRPHFLFGQQLGGKFSLMITLLRGAIRLLVGFVCADGVGRQWTICCFTMILLPSCGMWSLLPLGFIGRCPRR
jgi:hypothetical protein